MKLDVTSDQVLKMACLAIAASQPMGLGSLHFNPQDDHPNKNDVAKLMTERGIYIDYYNGRMVKFNVSKTTGGEWDFPDSTNVEYQSWARVYPSYKALANAAKRA